MNKRYQVFVSSTFEDLKVERRQVMHALLRLRCIPAGMELFTAANTEQWELIKRVINDSDYYVVIVGGKYGSIPPGEDISYTEKEYRYALEAKIPVLGFVHSDPASISLGKSEQDPEMKMKLQQFIHFVKGKPVNYWDSPHDLGRKLVESIAIIIQDEPAKGRVRGDTALDESQIKEVLNLQRRVRELEAELEPYRKGDPNALLEQLSPLAKFFLSIALHTRFEYLDPDGSGYWVTFSGNDNYLTRDFPSNQAAALVRSAVSELTRTGLFEHHEGRYRASAVAHTLEVTPRELNDPECPVPSVFR